MHLKHMETHSKIHVWIIDDDKRFCRCVSELLMESRGIRKVESYHTCESAFRALRYQETCPDVILLDIYFLDKEMTGYDFLRQVKTIIPDIKIIMATAFGGDEHVRSIIRHGAVGYINKVDGYDDVLRAIRIAFQGGVSIDLGTLARVMPSSFNDQILDVNNFTLREREIVDDLASGCSMKEIADKRYISFTTVNSHIKNIYRKLEVHSRSELIAKLMRAKKSN